MNLDQAWQSVLGQLQMEMPRASFDTWVRDTQPLTCENGIVTIGVRNQYARDWLENRLTSTVARLLAGMLNQGVEVRFEVASYPADESEEQPDPDEDEPGEDEAEIEVVNRLSYDEVVAPARIVAIPGYFSRLLPEIGARSAWLYVGWRQAVWNGERGHEGGSRSRRIAVSQVTRFSGLGRRTFFRATDDSFTWQALTGLVERQDLTPHWTQGRDRRSHRLPNKYTVHLTLPLSQADSHSVMEWLTECIQGGASLLNALNQAAGVKELVGELLPLAGSVSSQDSEPKTQTAMDIAALLNNGELSPELQAAAEKLHRKIIYAFGTMLITHYFLEKVIPTAKLTPPQAWLVTLLRDRCYVNAQTGEVRDEVVIRGGYAELASWLGLSRPKTIWEWVRDAKGAVSAFVAVLPLQEGDEPDALRLKIRLDEPLFDGAIDTIKLAQVALSNGAVDTINVAQMSPLNGANDTDGWRKWHSLKHLSTDLNTCKAHSTTEAETVAVPTHWVLRKLLVQNNAHPKIVKEMLAANASVQAFVSWVLFACSHAGEGINNPVAYALASLKEDPERGAGRAYDTLAALPPNELVPLIRWAVNKAGDKYAFTDQTSGNCLWDESMGASERHRLLLDILLGEGDDTPAWERRETVVTVDGEEALRGVEIIRRKKN
jgi:hypothetical protein